MTDEPKAGSGLDPETLAAYIDHRLPPEQRASVEAQLAADPDSYAVLVETMKAQDALAGDSHVAAETAPRSAAPARARTGYRWMIAAGTLAAAAALVLAVQVGPGWVQRLLGRDPVDPRMARLVAAVGEERYIEARLTGGFKYGPLRSVDRGAADLSRQNLALLAAAGEAQQAASENPTATNLHAWGVAQLLLRDVDGAIESLDGATLLDPRFAAAFADLAAAHLTSFQQTGRAEALPRAVEAAERVRQLGIVQVESLYTRALALELMHLRDIAIGAWREYLVVDPASPWAQDARRRLDNLTAANPISRWEALRDGVLATASAPTVLADLVREFPEEIPDLLLGIVVPAWVDAVGRGDDAAARWSLDRATDLAGRLSASGGDPSLGALVAELASSGTATRAGFEALGQGVRLIDQDQYLAAVPLLDRAHTVLSGAPTARGWAAFNLARAFFFKGDIADALALLDEAGAGTPGTPRSHLAARAVWIRGIIRFTEGRYDLARADYERALDLFDRAGVANDGATALMNIAVLYRFLGAKDPSWAFRVRALAAMPRHRPARYYSFLTSTAISASLDAMPLTALRVMDEAVSTTATLSPNVQAEARLQRARLLSRSGSMTEAIADLAAARNLVPSIADAIGRRRIEDSMGTAAAEVYQDADPVESISQAHAASESFRNRGDDLRTAELALYAARARVNLGEVTEAVEEIASGIDAFDRARATIPIHDPARLSAFEPAWGLFDENFAIRVGGADFDRAAAFAAFESSRARTVAEAVGAEVLPWVRLKAALDAETALVLLHQRDRELIVWHITAAADRLFRVPWDRQESARLVALARRELRLAKPQTAGTRIQETLLAPLLPGLKRGSVVVIVPDGAFHQVPWSGLHADDGAPLIARWAVAIAPSVTLGMRAAGVDVRPPTAALVVGAPAADGAAVLRAVSQEVRAVGTLYPEARVLIDEDATPDRVLQLLPTYRIVHVSAHAMDSPVYPMLSRLLLAGPGESGQLSVARIVKEGRADGALVVLATCTSIGSGQARGEGTVGLAWAFLRIGASAVVGSLWELDDTVSSPIFVRLHSGLRAGLSPARALRDAQLMAIGQGIPESEWAALQVVGRP